MSEQWAIDSPTAEENEIFEKGNEEARLKRKRFNWLSPDKRGEHPVCPSAATIDREYDAHTLALSL